MELDIQLQCAKVVGRLRLGGVKSFNFFQGVLTAYANPDENGIHRYWKTSCWWRLLSGKTPKLSLFAMLRLELGRKYNVSKGRHMKNCDNKLTLCGCYCPLHAFGPVSSLENLEMGNLHRKRAAFDLS